MKWKFERLMFELYAILLGVSLIISETSLNKIATTVIGNFQLFIMVVAIGLAIITRFDKNRADSYEEISFYSWGLGILVTLFIGDISPLIFWVPMMIGWALIGVDLRHRGWFMDP